MDEALRPLRRKAALIAIPVCGIMVPYLAEWIVSQDSRAVTFVFGKTVFRQSWSALGLGLLPYGSALLFAAGHSGLTGDHPGKASPPFFLVWACTFIPILALHFLFCRLYMLDEFDVIRTSSTAAIALVLVPIYLVGISAAGWVLALIGGYIIYLIKGPKTSDLEPLCKNCQYSLRGINSRRCPECGQEVHLTAEPAKHGV